jgi:hypothetical protein
MPAGSHGKTSTIFYYRGVPKNFTDFAGVAAGNYSIFQPTRPLLGTPFFSKSISNFIAIYR